MNIKKQIAVGLIVCSALLSCKYKTTSNQQKTAVLPTLSVGIQVSPAMALVMVAEEKGFFDSAGVNVELKEFTAGKFALQAFLGGSLDIAVSGEVPVALSTLQGNQFKVITQVVEKTINECRLVVRKEPGLDTPQKYFAAKKRKLATSFGGGPEFFTYSFLKKYNIPVTQLEELISQKPEDMPAAIASGSVDAVSIFDPFARQSEVQLGDKGITFADSSLYSELYVASVMEKTITEKSDELTAFLKGLHDASIFIQSNPEAAKAIVIKYTKLDQQIVNDIWNNFVFKPSINQRFTDFTTAQAKWAIEKGTVPKNTPIPDFNAVLYKDLLMQVDKTAVSVVQ